MHLGTIASAVSLLGAAAPAFADGLGPWQFFVVPAAVAVVGLAVALAVVLGGVWLARRGRGPGAGQ
jgi:hypothetical protein